MQRLPADFLDRSPEEAVRLIALGFLKDAAIARQRLTNPEDMEALHDFRVAVRRLRSCLRAFRPYVRDTVSKKMLRTLRDLTAATNQARDAEVMVRRVRDLSASVELTERRGIEALLQRLQIRQAESLQRLQGEVLVSFDDLLPRLQKRLGRFETTVHLDRRAHHQRFGQVAGKLMRRQAGDLGDRLSLVHGRQDVEQAHRARIGAKRLRYLVEPLTRRRKRAKPLVETLKSLQDLLGEVRDGQVLASEIASVAIGAPPEQVAETSPRSEDLVDLASRVEGRLAEQFTQVDRDWLGGRAEPFLKKVERFGERLSARRRAGPLEIERKFLLSGLPPHARDAVPLEIDQGWIAGQMVSERVRRTRTPRSETYSRTIKLGEGVARSEYEEPMTPDVFQSLWPLTASRRISKRRYPVPDGDRIWEIDEFLDRELVLAEVELENEGEEVIPPEWLEPFVVREVTGEPEYVNLNLAK